MRSPLLLASLVLTLACQGGPMAVLPPEVVPPEPGPPHFDFTSGRRLRARVITAEGAEPILQGIFDTERRQECQFQPASDGQLRCLPVLPESLQNTGLYADPECRFPIHAPRAACAGAPPRFTVAYRTRTGCSDRGGYDVFQLGPAAPGPRYHIDLRGCVPATGATDGLTATTPTPLTDWVEGTPQLRPDTGRLRARQVQSADGGRFTIALVDTHFGWDCRSSIQGNLMGHCIQPLVNVTGLFADASCLEPLYLTDSNCPRTPFIDGDQQVRGLGARWEGPIFGGERGGRCQPFDLKLPGTYYRYGEAIEPLTVPAVRLTRTGPGRLVREALEHEGQVITAGPYPSYYDDTLGNSCWPKRTASGLRCLAVGGVWAGGVEDAFADAACTRLLTVCPACEGQEIGLFSSDACGGPEHVAVHRVGPRHVGLVYQIRNGACIGPLDAKGPKNEPLVRYSIGEEISVERFAPLVERTE